MQLSVKKFVSCITVGTVVFVNIRHVSQGQVFIDVGSSLYEVLFWQSVSQIVHMHPILRASKEKAIC